MSRKSYDDYIERMKIIKRFNDIIDDLREDFFHDYLEKNKTEAEDEQRKTKKTREEKESR